MWKICLRVIVVNQSIVFNKPTNKEAKKWKTCFTRIPVNLPT